MIVYIYNIGVDLYNGFNGLRHRINWTYFTVLDGLAHPLYSLLDIDSGSVEIDSNYYIGALIENPEFSDFSNIKENLLFLGNLRSKLNIKELENLCRDFHLDLNDKKLLRNYSVGMKQKMGIIQAIMENQDILIFDEPTRGLDDYSIEVFIKKMKDLIEKGKTVIIASHDFVDIGYSRFITMKNGKLYEETAE